MTKKDHIVKKSTVKFYVNNVENIQTLIIALFVLNANSSSNMKNNISPV